MVRPDSYGHPRAPPPGGFPRYDMLPPPEVMEQKLAVQHVDMQALVSENQRLAATHATLRQELAAAQHELQMLHGHIEEMRLQKEQQTKGLMDKISRIEAELQAAEPIKVELQQARAEAHILVAARQDLISKVQQLTQELQRSHSDVQQIPFLLTELDSLRREYQHCRTTYDYEKKLYNDHLESLQVMEKNYVTMAREVEKLRAELTNTSNFDRPTGGQYGGHTGYSANDASGSYPFQNAYNNGFGIPQGRGPLSVGASSGGTGADASVSAGGMAAGATPTGAQSGPGYAPPVPPRASYDGPRAPSYDPPIGTASSGYDLQRGSGGLGHRGAAAGYESQRGLRYDGQRVPAYEPHRRLAYDGHGIPIHDAQGGSGHDTLRGSGQDTEGSGYDPSKNTGYDISSRMAGSQGHLVPLNNAPSASATPPACGAGTKYEAPPRGGSSTRR